MATISIITDYDTATLELKSVATLTGFVEELPTEVVTAQNVMNLQLQGAGVLSASDQAKITANVARTLHTVNGQLYDWTEADRTKDKGGQLAASTVDPVAVFDTALDPVIDPDAPITP